jgi:hypothetical protein
VTAAYRLVMPAGDAPGGELFRVTVQVGEGGPLIENAGVVAPGPAAAVASALAELATATRVTEVAQYIDGEGLGTGWAPVVIMTAAGGAPLDDALAGLRRIAEAAGIFNKTLEAETVAELCDILAAWCEQNRPGPDVLRRH